MRQDVLKKDHRPVLIQLSSTSEHEWGWRILWYECRGTGYSAIATGINLVLVLSSSCKAQAQQSLGLIETLCPARRRVPPFTKR